MLIDRGWLEPCNVCRSPNFDARPLGEEPSLLVIHAISLPPGEFHSGYIIDFFQNKLDVRAHPYFQTIANLRVSAHCLVDRKGEITQFVSFDDRAWHAGVSSFAGREKCNDYSIGIELEGCDEQLFTEQQYLAIAELTRIILTSYPAITPDRIAGHSDIAPGRKTDPGPGFDWSKYLALLEN